LVLAIAAAYYVRRRRRRHSQKSLVALPIINYLSNLTYFSRGMS
jgi:hypothetical protein